MIVSKTRNAPGWETKEDNLIPNGVKCNENVIWVSVLRLTSILPYVNGRFYMSIIFYIMRRKTSFTMGVSTCP